MHIHKSTIEEVRKLVNIEEVVASFIPLKKKGRNLWACCPFHHEKTPSFTVSTVNGFYKCFGCNVSGNAITFLMEMEGISFVEAIIFLAKKYNIDIISSNEGHNEVVDTRDSLFIVLSMAKQYYINILWETPKAQNKALKYCYERNFSEELLRKFELGYSLPQWDALYKYSTTQSYNTALLVQSGLVIEKNQQHYDRFRDRLIFPIHNIEGKIVGFAGRILVNTSDQPKYINSPETTIYQKRNTVYGIYQAKQAIRQHDVCYLVEGYTDVMALNMAGIEQVVASSGTAITENQIQLIRRFTKNITLVFDADAAGIQATLRGIDLLLENSMHVQVIQLPEQEDPASLLQQLGKDRLQDYFEINLQDFISFKVNLLMQDSNDDPIKKTNAIKAVMKSIALVPDTIQRAMFLKKCSKYLEIEEALLITELNSLLINKYHQPVSALLKHTNDAISETFDTRLQQSIEQQEADSIRMLLHYGSRKLDGDIPLYHYILKELEDVSFNDPICTEILALFQQKLKEDKIIDANYIIHHGSMPMQRLVIDLIAQPYHVSKHWVEQYQISILREEDDLQKSIFSGILRLKLRLIQQLILDNLKLLQQPEIQLDKENELLHIHTTLKSSEMEIAAVLGIVVTR